MNPSRLKEAYYIYPECLDGHAWASWLNIGAPDPVALQEQF